MATAAHRGRWILALGSAILVLIPACAYHSENRKKMAAGYYNQAQIYLQKGRGVEDEMNRRGAFGPLKEAIERDPSNPDYHIDLGSIYLYDHRFDDARKEFAAALKLDPQNSMAHQNMGQLDLATDHFEDALKEFDLALADYSYQTPWIAHFNKGRTYFDLKKYAAAVDSFNSAVAVAPDWGIAWQFLGQALEKDNRLAEAEKAFRRALELMPDSVVGTYYLGLVYFRQKKNAEALEQFRKTVGLDPEGELGKNAAKYLSILR